MAGRVMRGRWRLAVGAWTAGVLAGCARDTLPADTRLPRPDIVVVYDFHASPSVVNVDGNQFSYVMGAFDMPGNARSRVADATAAQQAIAATLLAQLRGMGLPAVPASQSLPAAGNALLITGDIINITEGIPRDLAAVEVGAAASAVNARSTLAYRFAGAPAQPWRHLSAAAPVTPSASAADAADAAGGTPMTMLAAQPADRRTAEVARQAHRLALRLAAQLRALFAAQGWVAAAP